MLNITNIEYINLPYNLPNRNITKMKYIKTLYRNITNKIYNFNGIYYITK